MTGGSPAPTGSGTYACGVARTAHPSEDDAPTGPHLARRPPPPTLDPPMTPFAIGGILAWALVGLVLLAVGHPPDSWLWICLAGFLWGFPGLLAMLRHDRRRRGRK
jgi:uncharacterized protein DUF2530